MFVDVIGNMNDRHDTAAQRARSQCNHILSKKS